MVLLSANDGMLHGFDASHYGEPSGGTELFAFVPDNSIENMHELTTPGYSHRFFVDGSPRAVRHLDRLCLANHRCRYGRRRRQQRLCAGHHRPVLDELQ